MKKTLAMVALMGLMVTWTGTAWADADTSNDDSLIVITITPNIDRGVEIDTSTVILNLGTMDLYAATQTVRPATVTVLGTLAAQELDLTGVIASAGTPWTFDATPSTDGTDGELDALAAYVLFSDTTLTVAPSATDFSNATAAAAFIGAGSQRPGGSGGTGTKHEKQDTGNVDMDDLAPADKAHMWLYFRLPNVTSGSAAQTVTLTLTAVDAS